MLNQDDWELSRPSIAQRIYDAFSLLLLMWPATAGMWLLASTRMWGYSLGLTIGFLGCLLAMARPLVFPSTPRPFSPIGFWIFAALSAFVVWSVSFAAVPYSARWEALRWVCLLMAAWSWTQMAHRARRWQGLLFLLLLSVSFQCLYATSQHINHSQGMVLWTLRHEGYGVRASGTYLCPNHFGNAVAMLIPVAGALLFLREAGFPLRLMSLYFLASAAAPLYWSLSRSAWIGTMTGLAVTILLLTLRRSRALFLVALVAVPLLMAGIGWTAWKTLPGVRERMGAVFENPERASATRIPSWKDSVAMIRDKPLMGFGGGSWIWTFPPYRDRVKGHLTFDYLHNDLIQMQVEYGAIGSGLLLLGILWGGIGATWCIVRTRNRAGAVLLAGAAGAAAASLAHTMFDFNFRIFPNPHVLVWILGVAWGVWATGELKDFKVPTWRRWVNRMGAAAAVAICAGGAWLAFAGGMSYWWNIKGELAREDLDGETALACYEKSIAWDSGNPQPYLGVAKQWTAASVWFRDLDPEVERVEREHGLAEAEASLLVARKKNSYDPTVSLLLARVYNLRDESERALDELHRTILLDPKHKFYREQVGIQLRKMGRDQEALETFKKNQEDGVASFVSHVNIRLIERKLAREKAATQ